MCVWFRLCESWSELLEQQQPAVCRWTSAKDELPNRITHSKHARLFLLPSPTHSTSRANHFFSKQSSATGFLTTRRRTCSRCEASQNVDRSPPDDGPRPLPRRPRCAPDGPHPRLHDDAPRRPPQPAESLSLDLAVPSCARHLASTRWSPDIHARHQHFPHGCRSCSAFRARLGSRRCAVRGLGPSCHRRG